MVDLEGAGTKKLKKMVQWVQLKKVTILWSLPEV